MQRYRFRNAVNATDYGFFYLFYGFVEVEFDSRRTGMNYFC